MTSSEDYSSLVKGLRKLDFSGNSVPCNLLLIGETAFPVLVSPKNHVLIAASKYGKGRIVVMSHEAYLNDPQFMDFLKNAISWLKPSSEAIIGVDLSFSNLQQTLSASGHKVEKVSGLKKDLGVLCTTGYDDGPANEIIAFLKNGGGLLIGAETSNWANKHKTENVLFKFPGNKITSVAGVYFTDSCGERGNFDISDQMPKTPWSYDVDFSADLKIFLQGITSLDLTGGQITSELLLHGPLTFPVGMTDVSQCFAGAAFFGRGRVFVEGHNALLDKLELKPFTINMISWLDMGRKGKIGVNNQFKGLAQILQNEGLPCVISDLVPELSVYCCHCFSEGEAEKIHQFVSEGGGLLMAGQSWYWSYSNPDVVSQYPGNKILNKFGISILSRVTESKVFKALVPQEAGNTYHFLRALRQVLRDLKSGAGLKPPLSSWISQLRKDLASFLMLPASPIVSSIRQELSQLFQGRNLPNVNNNNPIQSNSMDAFLICLAQELSCQNDPAFCNVQYIDNACVTVKIDATNYGDDAWRSTGLYLPPRKAARVVFPATAVGKGLQVQVGCQSDDLSSKTELRRAPVVVNIKKVVAETIVISSVWGGLLYVIVKGKSQLGIVPVKVYGAEPAPTFIKGQTSLSSWVDTIRKYPAPWAELITENLILTVPSDVIQSLDDPEALLSQWEDIMASIAELAAIPKKFLRPERFVTDVQISAGWMHAGYPIMFHLATAKELTDLQYIKNTGIWGPAHELGHNQQKGGWEFPPNTTEATCNLWSVYVHETLLGIPRDKAHGSLKPADRDARIREYLKNGAKLEHWHVWTTLETYLQLQGGFGWDPFKRLFSDYQTMSNVSGDNKVKMNLWAEKFSQAVNKNLAPFFQAWGWPIDKALSEKLSSLPAWEEDPMKTYV